jgi:hypothetical protein
MFYTGPSDGLHLVEDALLLGYRSKRGHLSIWSGDDLTVLHEIETNSEGHAVKYLVVYEEPTTGRLRLVTG